jgi:hypothetical protein
VQFRNIAEVFLDKRIRDTKDRRSSMNVVNTTSPQTPTTGMVLGAAGAHNLKVIRRIPIDLPGSIVEVLSDGLGGLIPNHVFENF